MTAKSWAMTQRSTRSRSRPRRWRSRAAPAPPSAPAASPALSSTMRMGRQPGADAVDGSIGSRRADRSRCSCGGRGSTVGSHGVRAARSSRCRPAWERSRRPPASRQRWRSPAAALPVTAMMGRTLKPLDLPDGADRVVAVHHRHHDVHQHDVDVGRCARARRSPRRRSRRLSPWRGLVRGAPSWRRCCGSRRRPRGSAVLRGLPSIGDRRRRSGRRARRRSSDGDRGGRCRTVGSQGRSAAKSSAGSTGLGT